MGDSTLHVVVPWLLLIAALLFIALNPGLPSPRYALLWLGIMAAGRGVSTMAPWAAVAVDLALFFVCILGMDIGGLYLVPAILAFAIADVLPRKPVSAG